MTDLYFGGSEIPGWRKLLTEQGVDHVALSYMGLRRRTKFSRPWLISEKYEPNQRVFLDSGAYTLNKAEEDQYTQGELQDIGAAYMAFVMQNLDAIEMVSEFDATALGREYIEAMREDFWDDIPEERFLPIWHPELGGLDDLDRLAQRYARVGILQTSVDGRNLNNQLNGIVQKYGTKLHGIAMTKPEVMSSVHFDSVASTSWLSPSQYGDTIVWTGKELKRYPKKYKEDSRKRHRTLFEQNGFDSAAIEADDSSEVLKLSIWSWQQCVANLDRQALSVVTTSLNPSTGEITEEQGEGVVTSALEVRNSVPTIQTLRDRPRTTLPVLGQLVQKETVLNEQGVSEERDVPLVQVRSSSMRMCDTCFLSKKCPAFAEQSNCAYDIPIEVKSKDQMQSLQNALIEMQTQRVMFMKMAEDMEGGYADQNLSKEVDRLQKLIKTKAELEEESFSLKIEAKERGKAGMISRLFGDKAGEAVQALPATPADMVIEQIIDIDPE